MVSPMLVAVKLLFCLTACAPERAADLDLVDPLPQLGASAQTRARLGRREGPRHSLSMATVGERPMAMRLDDPRLLDSRAYFGEGPSPMTGLGERYTSVHVEDGGEALQEALDALPPSRVSRLGVAALTADQIWGDTFHPGLCEDAEVQLDLDREGKDWVGSLEIPTFMEFAGDISPYLSPLSTACEAGILDSEGDLEAAMEAGDCVEDDLRQFFPEGSDCRACVEGNGGDFEACVQSEQCQEETAGVAWIEEESGPVWYQIASGYIWACAPDHTVLALLLGHFDPDGEMPLPFDHAGWGYLCLASWDPSVQDASFTCLAGDSGPERGDTLAEGVLGRVNGMWPEDEDSGRAYRNRLFYMPSMQMRGGVNVRWFWGFESGAGVVSLPVRYPDSNGNGQVDIEDENYGFGYEGWGVNPYTLRPDGQDPTSTEDTQARDWLASLTVKTATTRDGVPVHTYNHSRCLEWEGPDAEGSYRCLSMDIPDLGWQNDGQNTWTTSEFVQAYALPVATVASTGLPDPEIPGGFVPLLAGSPALADPDWDDCVWPYSFVPDIVPLEDTPGGFGGSASLWGQSYRFGKDPDLDLRVVLNTNQVRNFCEQGQ